ncbi:MAG TPA: hypothetical protein VFG09_15055 [Thermodesulfovibrionales bacterium]|jgi:hypothetical protein|nr:hypothetical protein [Thermodesulfovibrionales bacterium]
MKNKTLVNTLLLVAVLMAASMSNASQSGETMPLPAGEQSFTYDPVASPVLSTDPAQAKPIGVGSVANGGDTFDITVALDKLSGPVDVAFGIYASSINPTEVFFLDSSYSLKPFSKAAVAVAAEDQQSGKRPHPIKVRKLILWKMRINDLNEGLLVNVPLSVLPSGQYTLILDVSPSGTNGDDSDGNGEDTYYRWITSFGIN